MQNGHQVEQHQATTKTDWSILIVAMKLDLNFVKDMIM